MSTAAMQPTITDRIADDRAVAPSENESAEREPQGPSSTLTWPLVGRDDELAVLADATRAGRSVVVTGRLGTGRSRLVNELVARRRRDSDASTIMVRATRSARCVPFGVFAEWVPSFARGGDGLRLLRSLADTLADARERAIVVDDGQHLDHGSAALIHELVRRGAASVITVRSDEPCPDGIVALWKDGLVERVELRPLSEREMVETVEQALGGTLTHAAQRRLWHLTSGNPLHVTELVRACVSQRVLEHHEGMWCWHGRLRAGDGRLDDLLTTRIDGCSERHVHLLELLGVGGPLPIEVVTELGLLDESVDLEEDGLVTLSSSEAEASRLVSRIELTHPVYGEVLRAGVGELARRRDLGELGRAALAIGWHDHDALTVATWCLLGDVEGVARDVWLQAAEQAFARRDWRLGERLARAADDAGGGMRAAIICAVALAGQRRWSEAEALLARLNRDVARTGADIAGAVCAHAARVEADGLLWSCGDADAAMMVLLDAAEAASPPQRAALLAHSASVAAVACRPVDAVWLGEQAASYASGRCGPFVHGRAAASMGHALLGHVSAAMEAAEPILDMADWVVDDDPYPLPSGICGYLLALILDGRLDAAFAIAEEQLSRPKPWPDGSACVPAQMLCRLGLIAGRLDVARRWGCEAQHGIDAGDARPVDVAVAASLAAAAAQCGDVASAEASLRWAEEAGSADFNYRSVVGIARAWLLAARGEMSDARDEVRGAVAWARDRQAWAYEMFGLIELLRLGAPSEATLRLTELAATIEGPLVDAVARYAAYVTSCDGRGLDDVSAELESMGMPLLAAEASAHAVPAHRASGRRSSSIAAGARARQLAALTGGAATSVLRDLDGAPTAVTLTGREREVVELAARGLANAEIAERLYISVRTVHSHLSHVYTKLGTSERSELGAAIGLT